MSCRSFVLQAPWSSISYSAEFPSVDISCQSSAKRSQSTANSKIWEPLAFADHMTEVWKSCQKLVLQGGGPHGPCGPSFATRLNFQVWISRANRVPNNRKHRQTAIFWSLWSWLTISEKFRRVAKTSFFKGLTTWAMWPPVCYWGEFPSVDISWQSSAKSSESTPDSIIWEPLAFAEEIREVNKSVSLFRDIIFNLTRSGIKIP